MISQTVFIDSTSSSDVYSALLDSATHSEITGDKAVIKSEIGTKFSTFSGYATGEIINLKTDELIEMTWRASDWPDGHYSMVKFNFSEKDDGTEINFEHSNIPEGRESEYEQGWEDNYWIPLRSYFQK